MFPPPPTTEEEKKDVDQEDQNHSAPVAKPAQVPTYQVSAMTSFLLVTTKHVYVIKFDPFSDGNGEYKFDKV